MLSINRKTMHIKLTKGDTASFKVFIQDLTGHEYKIQSGDLLTLTVRAGMSSATALLVKTATPDLYFQIDHSDTSSINVGVYVYDVLLETAQGEYYTIVAPSLFELTQEITR